MSLEYPTHPKSLRDPRARQQRASLLREPHIAPLTELVERIRKENGLGEEVPYLDPLDAGTNAECIFILQAPGPGAVESGFVSRDNDDESARHFFELTREAGLDRRRTVTWNAVPWHMEGSSITETDLEDGLEYLDEVIDLLENPRVLVLLGEKAQRLERQLFKMRPRLKRFSAPLPSPQFINRSPDNRARIAEVLRQVADYLGPHART